MVHDIVCSAWKHAVEVNNLRSVPNEYRLNIKEQLHGDFATYLFNTMVAEGHIITKDQLDSIKAIIKSVISHEYAVIDEAFKNCDSINGITPVALKSFILSRVNTVISNLNLDITPYISEGDTISEWFFEGIDSIKTHDFFAGGTTQYSKNWSLEKFSALKHMEAHNDK